MAKEKERAGVTGSRLDLREDTRDELLVEDLVADFGLFSGRVDAKKLASQPGALILRHYKRGEIICRQADPGWTAFWIIPKADIYRLRVAQIEATEAVIRMDASLGALDGPGWARLTRTMAQRESADEATRALYAEAIKIAETDLAKLKTDKQKELHAHKQRELAKTFAEREPGFLDLPIEQKKAKLASATEDAERSARLASQLARSVPPTRLAELKAEAAELKRRADNPADLRPVSEVFITFRPSEQSQRLRGVPAQQDPLTRFMGSLKRAFGLAPKAATPGRPPPKSIPIDGPVDLPYQNPIAQMAEGEIWGEMSCMNRTPRSASVRASDDCYMLEFLRPILEMLQKNDSFNQMMLEKYKERVLSSQLEDIDLFRGLAPTALERLKAGLEISYFEPGDVIFKEGDPALSMYVIRVGHVKIQRTVDGVTTVLGYAGRGELIGEMGLIEDKPRNATCQAYDHPEEAKGAKSKLGRVELMMVKKPLFDELRQLDSKLEQRIQRIMEARRAEERRLEERIVAITGPVDDFGLLQGKKLMLIDLERCTRCDDCVRACASTHADGRSRLIREGPRFGNFLVPASCRQCRDPVCMIGCPVGSIHKGAASEVVIEDWCVGCGICAEQCPYGSIHMHERSEVEIPEIGGDDVKDKPMAVCCDQCSSLVDGVPSCVYACPHDAAGRVDAWSFFSDADNAFRSLGKLTYENLDRQRAAASGG